MKSDRLLRLISALLLLTSFPSLSQAEKSTEFTEEELEKARKKWRVFQINVFLVTLPCLLIFSFVFACYVAIWKQEKLHGWIVLAITGSLTVRFGALFLADLPVLYLGWEHWNTAQGLCVTLGELDLCVE